jgi:hypothetical protein
MVAEATNKRPVYLRGIPSDVIRDAKVAAARRGITLAGFVAGTLSRAMREADDAGQEVDDLDREMRWYERNRERVTRAHGGEYVAIVGAKVIDHDRDFERLAKRVFARTGVRNVFMPHVSIAEPIVPVRSPRVRRGA